MTEKEMQDFKALCAKFERERFEREQKEKEEVEKLLNMDSFIVGEACKAFFGVWIGKGHELDGSEIDAYDSILHLVYQDWEV